MDWLSENAVYVVPIAVLAFLGIRKALNYFAPKTKNTLDDKAAEYLNNLDPKIVEDWLKGKLAKKAK